MPSKHTKHPEEVLVSIIYNRTNMECEYYSSIRNNEKLTIVGFAYIVEKKSGEKAYWKCDMHRICRARLVTKNRQIVSSLPQHQHEEQSNRINAEKSLAEMKDAAVHNFRDGPG